MQKISKHGFKYSGQEEYKKKYMAWYRAKHRKHINKMARKWKREHPQRVRQRNIEERNRLKVDVFSHYSKGKIRCNRCGYSKDIRALELDHVEDSGNSHRTEVLGDYHRAGTTFYRWLKKNNYPKGFQVLCANCNRIKEIERRSKGNGRNYPAI